MREIKLEDLALDVILQFCENAAELGCPRDKDVDMWIRELAEESPDEARKVMDKLFMIMDRNRKLALNDVKNVLKPKKAKKCSVCKKKIDKGAQITSDWIKGLLKKSK